jgi:hypothetical protein
MLSTPANFQNLILDNNPTFNNHLQNMILDNNPTFNNHMQLQNMWHKTTITSDNAGSSTFYDSPSHPRPIVNVAKMQNLILDNNPTFNNHM